MAIARGCVAQHCLGGAAAGTPGPGRGDGAGRGETMDAPVWGTVTLYTLNGEVGRHINPQA